MENDRSHAFFGGAIAVLCLILLASCAAHTSKADYGTLTIAVGPARELETGWPAGAVPAFASVTVRVSADDMDAVTQTVSPYDENITMKIPAGDDRLVEVKVVPAYGDGAPAYAASYGGVGTVDLEAGVTTTLVITLSLYETKLVLPDTDNSSFRTASSLSGVLDSAAYSSVTYSEYLDFDFDERGRLFYSDSELGLCRITLVDEASEQISGAFAYTGVAYSSSSGRLYYVDSSSLCYVDVATETVSSLGCPSELAGFTGAIAADGTTVYVDGYNYLENPVISKISLEGSSFGTVTNAVHASLGLQAGATPLNLNVEDMIVRDDVLYILASYVVAGYYSYDLHSCGKLIAVDAATMSPLWETGWNEDAVPSDGDDATFYGPIRFVGLAPKKLYVADEGFYWSGVGGSALQDVDRVVEIDLEAEAVSGIGQRGAVVFFSKYTDIVLC